MLFASNHSKYLAKMSLSPPCLKNHSFPLQFVQWRTFEAWRLEAVQMFCSRQLQQTFIYIVIQLGTFIHNSRNLSSHETIYLSSWLKQKADFLKQRIVGRNVYVVGYSTHSWPPLKKVSFAFKIKRRLLNIRYSSFL